MDSATYRIIDANLNRAREGLRVLEEYARFVLNDARVSASIKGVRHALADAASAFGRELLLAGRDTPGDVGTTITTASESSRSNSWAVAQAASARVSEALRCIEEYGKLVSVEASRRIERLRYDHYSIEQELFVVSPRRRRLIEARLHVLLTESLCKRPWLETAEAVLQAGADAIQLREKTLSDKVLLDRARTLRELTRRHDALLVINDRPDIARLVGADAVHLGQEDLPVAAARGIAGPTILIGGSAHDSTEIEHMLAAGVDYLGVGPMFASGTKPGMRVNGPALLSLAAQRLHERDDAGAEAARALPVSLVAIGGISAENAAALVETERRPFAIAVCGAIIGAPDPAEATRHLLAAIGGRARVETGAE